MGRMTYDDGSQMFLCKDCLPYILRLYGYDEALCPLEELAEVTPLGPQEPPDDPMIYNRRQTDGTFRSLAGFWEREATLPAEEDEALRQQKEECDAPEGLV